MSFLPLPSKQRLGRDVSQIRCRSLNQWSLVSGGVTVSHPGRSPGVNALRESAGASSDPSLLFPEGGPWTCPWTVYAPLLSGLGYDQDLDRYLYRSKVEIWLDLFGKVFP